MYSTFEHPTSERFTVVLTCIAVTDFVRLNIYLKHISSFSKIAIEATIQCSHTIAVSPIFNVRKQEGIQYESKVLQFTLPAYRCAHQQWCKV